MFPRYKHLRAGSVQGHGAWVIPIDGAKMEPQTASSSSDSFNIKSAGKRTGFLFTERIIIFVSQPYGSVKSLSRNAFEL
jgi:hypothetical protein